MNISNHCLIPDWPAPKNVRALQTTRNGGASAAPYASLNLGDHVGDEPLAVERNRMLLEPLLPSEPVWLKQVHGTAVVDAGRTTCWPEGDACVSSHPGAVCVVMTADCLPVLLCDERGSVVGAVHAGWRGLCDGIIESTVRAMNVPPDTLMAWLGPAIGPSAFKVGEEVRAAFIAKQREAAAAFFPSPPTPDNFASACVNSTLDLSGSGLPDFVAADSELRVLAPLPQAGEGGRVSTGRGKKWLADIYQLARLRLNALGITRIYGGGLCTHTDSARFFSYRHDGVTGRMGTFIWLE